MSKVTLLSSGPPSKTQVLVDDKLISGVQRLELKHSTDQGFPIVTLTVRPRDVVVLADDAEVHIEDDCSADVAFETIARSALALLVEAREVMGLKRGESLTGALKDLKFRMDGLEK